MSSPSVNPFTPTPNFSLNHFEKMNSDGSTATTVELLSEEDNMISPIIKKRRSVSKRLSFEKYFS